MADDEIEYLISSYTERVKAESCLGKTYIVGGVPHLATRVAEETGKVFRVLGTRQDPHPGATERAGPAGRTGS
ncbi:MAG TPA: hypothetical protein VE990_14100 [Acidimicrobiales bacterium]|nr:hypothetical protein [Acidimicrobiales bacterium]